MSRWSDCLYKLSKEYQLRGKRKKENKNPQPNKYKARRTAAGFPSQLEERVYGELLFLEKAGLLKNVKRYPTYHLGGKLRWKCDFTAFSVELDTQLAIEAKGMEDGRFTAIRQIWPAVGPHPMRIYEDAKNGRLKFRDIKGKVDAVK